MNVRLLKHCVLSYELKKRTDPDDDVFLMFVKDVFVMETVPAYWVLDVDEVMMRANVVESDVGELTVGACEGAAIDMDIYEGVSHLHVGVLSVDIHSRETDI